MDPSVIQAGNFSLRTFEENGVHTHAAGIESYYRLGYNAVVPLQKSVMFSVSNPILLKTLWLSSASGFNSGDEIYLTLASDAHGFSQTTTISIETISIDSAIAVWEIPTLILEPEFRLDLSANFEIAQFSFFAKPCNIYPFILGQLL